MTAIFNKDLENEEILQFDLMEEFYQKNNNTLEFFVKFSKSSFEKPVSLVEYCENILNIEIQNIYCYENGDENPTIIFNKTYKVISCKTSLSNNEKLGTLMLLKND